MTLVEQAVRSRAPLAPARTPTRTQPPPARRSRIVFIDIGRTVGALAVFYSHLTGELANDIYDEPDFFGVLDTLTSEPMHVQAQGIGQLAIPFFFLVSGFVVTPLALKQGQLRFGLNRLIRVYLPIVFTVLLTSLVMLIGLDPPSTGQSQELTPWTVLTNTSLVNYLIFPQVVLVPVAWTMIVEVLFYLLLLILLPIFRRWVWLAIAIELTLIFVIMISRSQLGESYSLLGVNVSYLPALIIGQIIWATTTRKLPLWAGGAFTAIAWSLYVLADVIDVGRLDSSYSLSLAFACVCFLMGLFAEPRLRQRRLWTELSERTYSIYLLHSLVSLVLLQLLVPHIPVPIALIISVAATFGVVELCYRFIERPSHKLARHLSYRRVPKAHTVSKE